jgi:hypothetical protein
MRGGAHDPMSREELEAKFTGNMLYGGFSEARAAAFKQAAAATFKAANLARFAGFELS